MSDVLALVHTFGYPTLAAVIGHDFGSPVAAWCALIRPDVLSAVVLMSAPFGGPTPLPYDTVNDLEQKQSSPAEDIYEALAGLARPRKHYQRYYATREANNDIWHPPQGIHDFLRAYYIMDLNKGMAATVAPEMPSASEIAKCSWLTDEELNVYSTEYGRNGFQGGLQNYRVGTILQFSAGIRMFSGWSIDVPSCFIAGASDWGPYQRSGTLEKMLKGKK